MSVWGVTVRGVSQVPSRYNASQAARLCSRSACSRPATATLTFAYADMTAVLGPLAPYVDPHSYDLCVGHAERTVVPRGWAVVRLDSEPDMTPRRTGDDLEALADAVREAGRTKGANPFTDGDDEGPTRRGHLRAVPTVEQ